MKIDSQDIVALREYLKEIHHVYRNSDDQMEAALAALEEA